MIRWFYNFDQNC